MGANSELENTVVEMDEARIHNFLLDQSCDWFEFKRNPPSASHMGGVWYSFRLCYPILDLACNHYLVTYTVNSVFNCQKC